MQVIRLPADGWITWCSGYKILYARFRVSTTRRRRSLYACWDIYLRWVCTNIINDVWLVWFYISCVVFRILLVTSYLLCSVLNALWGICSWIQYAAGFVGTLLRLFIVFVSKRCVACLCQPSTKLFLLFSAQLMTLFDSQISYLDSDWITALLDYFLFGRFLF